MSLYNIYIAYLRVISSIDNSVKYNDKPIGNIKNIKSTLTISYKLIENAQNLKHDSIPEKLI